MNSFNPLVKTNGNEEELSEIDSGENSLPSASADGTSNYQPNSRIFAGIKTGLAPFPRGTNPKQ
ncbi:hypothetical protein [Adhaeribacter soli]|uniref:Uncharacterized protein n=1 Tax=Adhaeribacter soli TaxID=2607655 RepID=A0A5N1IPV6_9BACT|nr:hypothetical protein [Adhaeribacter soli]KAA9331798.1 hypothetical protein F0P94_13410 [Adhaeribacter soli]